VADKKLVIGVDVEIGNAKVNLEQLRDAAVKFGDDGARHADGLTRSLQATENAINGYERKLTETGNVGERDIVKIVRAIEVMRTQGVAAFGSLANAPKEFQQALTNAEAKLHEASATVGKLNNAVRDNTANVQANANQWAGLGNAIEGAGGKTGAIVGKLGLVTAAFSEGWSIGMKMNHLFGTDMALWEEVVARFGSKLGAVVRAASDMIVSDVNLVRALFTGNLDEIKKAVLEHRDNMVSAGKVMYDVVTRYGKAWDDVHPSIKETEARMKAAAEAAEQLAEKKKKLADEIHNVTKNLEAENKELAKQNAIAEDAKLKAFELGGDVGYLTRQLDSARAAVDAQAREVEKLSAQFGEQSQITIAARQKLEELERQVGSSGKRYEDASHQLDQYKQTQQDAERSSVELQKKIAEEVSALAAKMREQMNAGKAQQAATGDTKNATTATDAHTEATKKTHTELVIYTDALGKVHKTIKTVTDETKPAADGMKALGTATEDAAGHLSSAVEHFISMHTEIVGINAAVKEFISTAPAAVAAFDSVAAAAAKAAGTQQANQYVNTSEGP
jgi:archaellum component FlaC